MAPDLNVRPASATSAVSSRRNTMHGAFSIALINSDQLAEMLSISRKGLYHALDSGQIPSPIKIGNRLRWRIEDIESWLEGLAEVEARFRGLR